VRNKRELGELGELGELTSFASYEPRKRNRAGFGVAEIYNPINSSRNENALAKSDYRQ